MKENKWDSEKESRKRSGKNEGIKKVKRMKEGRRCKKRWREGA